MYVSSLTALETKSAFSSIRCIRGVLADVLFAKVKTMENILWSMQEVLDLKLMNELIEKEIIRFEIVIAKLMNELIGKNSLDFATITEKSISGWRISQNGDWLLCKFIDRHRGINLNITMLQLYHFTQYIFYKLTIIILVIYKYYQIVHINIEKGTRGDELETCKKNKWRKMLTYALRAHVKVLLIEITYRKLYQFIS